MKHVYELENKKERINRTWIVQARGTTHEGDVAISHRGRLIRFDMPISYKRVGRFLKNNKNDVAWLYNNLIENETYLDEEIMESHLINANDLSPDIVDLIPYVEIFIGGTYSPMSSETYSKKHMYGH